MSNIEIIHYSSIEELVRALGNKFFVFGTLNQFANKFEYVKILESGFKCGLSYNYTGLKPIILETSNARLFIGFDKTILCIDQHKNKVLQKKNTGSLFYEFIDVEEYALLVAICELDLMVINYEGETIWSIGFRDIVEDYHKEGELLNVKCSDGENYVYNIQNGKLIND